MATGLRVNLKGAKTVEELIKVSSGVDTDTLWCDPFWYSEIYLPPTADTSNLDGNFHDNIKAQVRGSLSPLDQLFDRAVETGTPYVTVF